MLRIYTFFGVLFLISPLWAAPKVEAVTLTTKDGWSLAASYLPSQSQNKTVVLLHDLNKKKEDL